MVSRLKGQTQASQLAFFFFFKKFVIFMTGVNGKISILKENSSLLTNNKEG